MAIVCRERWVSTLLVLLIVTQQEGIYGHQHVYRIGILTDISDSSSSSYMDPVTAAGVMACRHANERITTLVRYQLPANTSVECTFKNIANSARQGVEATLQLTEVGVDVIVGPHRSVIGGPVSVVALLDDTPVISFWATAAALSDKTTYPNFARTVPTLSAASFALCHVFVKLGWKKFAMLYPQGDYGSEWSESMITAAVATDLDVSTTQWYRKSDETSIPHALEQIKASGAHIIVTVIRGPDLTEFVRVATELGLTGPGYQWITAGPSWAFPMALQESSGDWTQDFEFLKGFLAVEIDPFEGGLFQAVWGSEDEADVCLPGMASCGDDSARINDQECPAGCGYMYDAVFTAAIASADAERVSGLPLDKATVLERLRHIDFQGATGVVKLDDALDRSGDGLMFKVKNFQASDAQSLVIESVQIAQWTQSGGLVPDPTAAPVWSSGRVGWGQTPVDGSTCQAGEVFSHLALRCVPCPAGTFQTVDACLPCPPGTFASHEATTRCSSCARIGYADRSGQDKCTECPSNMRMREGLNASSIDNCECQPGYLFDCSLHFWKAIVIALCVAITLVGLVVCRSWLMTSKTDDKDQEERLIAARAKQLRTLLLVDRHDGFLLAGESLPWSSRLWRSRAIPLRRGHLEHLARLTLLLPFDRLSVDAFAHLVAITGRDSSRPLLTGSFVLRGDGNECRCGSGRSDESAQLTALRQLLLDICRLLLDPNADAQPPAKSDLSWVGSRTAGDRFDFFQEHIAKLRLWEEEENLLALKGVAQMFMDDLRVQCDNLHARIQQEPGGMELVTLQCEPAHTDVTRQNDPDVSAIRIDKYFWEEVEVQRSMSSSPPFKPAHRVSSPGPLSLASTQESSASDAVMITASVAPVSFYSALQSPYTQPDIACAGPQQDGAEPRPESVSAAALPVLQSQASWEGTTRSLPRIAEASLTAVDPDSGGTGDVENWRASAAPCSPKTALRKMPSIDSGGSGRVKRYRALQTKLRNMADSATARRTSRELVGVDNEELAVMLAGPVDEEACVHQLWLRARLLDNGFQAKVRELFDGGMRSSVVQIVHGPVKTKTRMLEKVEVIKQELVRRGEPIREALPLSGLILDPVPLPRSEHSHPEMQVRATVVLDSAQAVAAHTEWLVENGPSLGLPVVRVKNKFGLAPEDSVEFDGYRDVMVCVLFTGERGLRVIGEVQLQERRMAALKAGMHRLYKVKRATSAQRI